MSRILAVGIATIDIINSVTHYPPENAEVRVTQQRILRGGNATNTLVVLSQLGHQCDWAGVLINEPDSVIVEHDLRRYQIDYSHCHILPQGKMPTSYITLSETTGSRTIVHHRDCPEYDFAHFQTLDLSVYDWVHFEGRHVDDLCQMLDWLKAHYPELPCSVEIEKPRENIESVFDKPDVLMCSQHYAQSCGFETATQLLEHIDTSAIMTCTWGADGAWLKQADEISHQPACPPHQIVDTLAAGDTFNAGLISALIEQQPANLGLQFASQLAGKKCGQLGLDNLVN